MDEPTRRAWSKPELIVLVRSGPEEDVLTMCKGDYLTGPNSYGGACTQDPGCAYPRCETFGPS